MQNTYLLLYKCKMVNILCQWPWVVVLIRQHLRWYGTPLYYDVIPTEINNIIKYNFKNHFFPYILYSCVAQLVSQTNANLQVMSSNPAGAFIIFASSKNL